MLRSKIAPVVLENSIGLFRTSVEKVPRTRNPLSRTASDGPHTSPPSRPTSAALSTPAADVWHPTISISAHEVMAVAPVGLLIYKAESREYCAFIPQIARED